MHQHSHHDHAFNKSVHAAFLLAVVLTSSFIVVEVIYALFAHSMSLLADAVHNLGDVLGLLLAWGANWLLSLPSRERYSYGFKRMTIIAALANAFILVATSMLIVYQSIEKLYSPTAIHETTVIIVGTLGVIVNGACSLLFMRHAHHDLNVKGAFLHLAADALILAGVVVGAIIIKYTDLVWIDPVLSLVIVAIVLWGAWGLLRDSLHLILDAVPRYIDYLGVTDYLQHLPGVKTVHDLHIWGLSTREVALTAHLIMPDNFLSDEDYRNINEILHKRFNIQHITLQVEKGDLESPCIRLEKC